jgi:hypothetical protein
MLRRLRIPLPQRSSRVRRYSSLRRICRRGNNRHRRLQANPELRDNLRPSDNLQLWDNPEHRAR